MTALVSASIASGISDFRMVLQEVMVLKERTLLPVFSG